VCAMQAVYVYDNRLTAFLHFISRLPSHIFLFTIQGLGKDGNHLAGSTDGRSRSEWSRRVAQCIHLNASWIKIKVIHVT